MARIASRKGLTSGFYAIIPERLVTSPAFASLPSMREVGLYFLLLGKSDVFGCLPLYPTIEMTKSGLLGALAGAMSNTEFRNSMRALLEAKLFIPLSWGGGHVLLLPHKLPTANLSYYPVPRLLPVNVIMPHLHELAETDFYLADMLKDLNVDRILEHTGVAEGVAMALVDYPDWMTPPSIKRRKTAAKQAEAKRKKESPVESEPKKMPRTSNDFRVIELQDYICDCGFDIEISDDDMLAMLVKYGKKYLTRMIDLYGDWRLVSPNKAKNHKNHARAINATWVHEKAKTNTLPNPNDELIELRWNVLITGVEKSELMEQIKIKLKESDPHNQKEWLVSLADRVSGMKTKSGITSTDMDANYILEQIERQSKWRNQ